jgi:hypothetical protein
MCCLFFDLTKVPVMVPLFPVPVEASLSDFELFVGPGGITALDMGDLWEGALGLK